jgi:bifunctional non-homologous end joining protein LigD
VGDKDRKYLRRRLQDRRLQDGSRRAGRSLGCFRCSHLDRGLEKPPPHRLSRLTPDYAGKRAFDKTPEPVPEVAGDVDPGAARPGDSFVIHQHHARRLHFDLRLEMFNGTTPVLVSWAVPKNLPIRKGERVLAIHVEDHPFEYVSFSGTIPAGNYGAGEVRIFDDGSYEMLEQKEGKLTFRLTGKRLKGVWHLIQTSKGEKDKWLGMLKEWEGKEQEALPSLQPMLPSSGDEPFDDPDWAFEPLWEGARVLAACDRDSTMLVAGGEDLTARHPELSKVHDRLVSLSAVLDGVVVGTATRVRYAVFDLLYLDGRSLIDEPLSSRRKLLEDAVVPADFLDLSPSAPGQGTEIFAAAVGHGLGGIVAKRLSSPYKPGTVSSDWLRIAKAELPPRFLLQSG